MKTLILLATVVVACNAVGINPAALAGAEGVMGADTSKWTPLQCRDGSMGPNDDRMKEIGGCAAEYGPGKKNPNCAYFCQAKHLGLLSSAGVPRTEIYDRWVQETFPARLHGVGKAWFRDCYQKYGKFVGPNDKDCQYAKSFGDCTWQIVPHLTCPKA